MNIVLMGGAGFIGTNLALKLSENPANIVTVVDTNETFFQSLKSFNRENILFRVSSYQPDTNFDEQLTECDLLFHLASTNIPTTSNQSIASDLGANIVVTARMLDSCVKQKVKKIVFISSGGTVYGTVSKSPISEDTLTYPINSYGLQKITIEKLLYLYYYQYAMNYSVIRLANPYGPYQRPNGKLGVVTTFIYHALTDSHISVYGDGSVVRDFIYIDDAIDGILKVAYGNAEEKVFNLGSGVGTSINEVIDVIRMVVSSDLQVLYTPSRSADVPVNYLDVSRFEKCFGHRDLLSLEEGVRRTALFLKNGMSG